MLNYQFVTLSGSLTAKKILVTNDSSTELKKFQNDESKDAYIELDFPADSITEFKFDDTSLIYEALDGASIIDIKRTQIQDDILVIPNPLLSSLSITPSVSYISL